MNLTYLGTAAAEGWPGIFCRCKYCEKARILGGKDLRTRSQALLDDTLLFDLGPDTYMHMLRDGLDMPGIRYALITHTHQDHFYPIELLFRSHGFAHGVDETLTLYGSDAMLRAVKDSFKSYPDDSVLRRGKISCREIMPYEPTDIAGYRVAAMLATHDKSERCYIYLVEKDGQVLLYGNDTGIFPDETWDYLKGRRLNLVSLDCTMGRFKEGSNHMGIPDVIEVKERLIQMGCADKDTHFVATHFSHNGQLMHRELIEELSPHGIEAAYDGMKIKV